MAKKKCPKCGSDINIFNHKCTRFPYCTYVSQDENKNILEIRDYVVFDLETTGFNKKEDRIIEIGAVKIKDGQIVDNFSMLCNPGLRNGRQIFVNAKITDLTGIRNADLKDKPLESEAVQAFSEWLSDMDKCVAVAHNGASFDIPFLKSACRRLQIPFRFYSIIDTVRVAKSLDMVGDGLIANNKQPTLAQYFGIEYDAHRAVNDCQCLQKIYSELLNMVSENGKEIFAVAC